MNRGGGCSSRPSNDPDVCGCANKVAPFACDPSLVFDVTLAILNSASPSHYLLPCFFMRGETGLVLRSCNCNITCCIRATYL